MRLLLSTLVFCLSLFNPELFAESILFKNSNIVSMKSEAVDEKQDLLVIDGVISSIQKTGHISVGEDTFIIDATDKFLMPGLSEMHAHVPGDKDLETRNHYLYLYLINGITTIRGMLGDPSHLVLRKELAQGKTAGPRLITSGPSLNGNSIISVKQAKKMVQQQAKAGYDFLKLHPGLSKEEFIAIADEANKFNIPFGGHVSDDVGLELTFAKRQATIDHLDQFFRPLFADIHADKQQDPQQFFGINFVPYIDKSKIKHFAHFFSESNSWLVPTETLMDNLANEITAEELADRDEMKYVSASLVNSWKNAKKGFNAPKEIKQGFLKYRAELLKAIQKNNGKILLGSDAPQIFNVPGFSIHRELELMVRSGLSPFQALRTGTVNAAKFFNESDKAGTLEVGKRADIVVLSKNPLTDIKNTKTIQGVLHKGIWINQDSIDRYLKNYLKRPSN
ncbi:amidohydrolase family protein [Kangiella sp. HZ709]|uniref:amidohydrolase family protein n=1 Tax=Kangiella sp. HZ709 TaxID=2666328 RepID=UPI0012AF35F0|nr:amidohydrolase family protein [Kangiella sp. HZ709]MRX27214.1 amidohydrolase family protein [Kangiella sp. HZ709]